MKKYLAQFTTVIISSVVVVGIVSAATTISTNINTGGKLTVTGTATSSILGSLSVGSSTVWTNGIFDVGTSTSLNPFFHVDLITGNVGIGTSTPTSAFEVAGKNASFNSSQDGSLGPWVTNANPFPVTVAQNGQIVANGYIYVIDGLTSSVVYYAKLNGDGSVGTWTLSPNSLPVGLRLLASAVQNGYIYVLGGRNSGGSTLNTVYYTKLNSDGSTGAWTSLTAMPDFMRGQQDSFIANGYLYYISGAGSNVYYAKLNADGTIGSWVTNSNFLPDGRYAPGIVYANGYVYVISGLSTSDFLAKTTVYYAKLNSDGSIGSWSTAANSLPVGYSQGAAFVSNGYVYFAGGLNGTVSGNVYYAKLNSDGSVGVWTTTNLLPSPRQQIDPVVANGYVYIVGGGDLSGNYSNVWYTSTSRVKISGSLDLLGSTLGAAPITDSSGEVGGSLYAGNIYSSNKLEVSGNTQLWNGLSIAGPVSITGATSTVPSPIFSIATSSNTSIFSILSSGNVGIGSIDTTASLQVASTTNNSTSTLELGKSGQNKGSCFVLYDTAGNTVYAFIPGGTVTFTLSTTTSCR